MSEPTSCNWSFLASKALFDENKKFEKPKKTSKSKRAITPAIL